MLKRSFASALAMLLCSPLVAQCVQPQRPPPVDVKTQDGELLQATYRAARQFLYDADAFLRCIENTERQLAESSSGTDVKAARRRAFHATVDDIRAVNANLQKQSAAYLQSKGTSLESAFAAAPQAAIDTVSDDQPSPGDDTAAAPPAPHSPAQPQSPTPPPAKTGQPDSAPPPPSATTGRPETATPPATADREEAQPTP